MSQPRSLDSLSRQELFDLVWSMPVTKIAADYGVTDPAIHKRCKKLQVPTPPRGYWAKKEYGKAPKQPVLPPSQEEIFAKEAAKPVPASFALPQDSEALHPLAREFFVTLKSSSLSYDKHRVHLEKGEFPKAEISKAQAARAAGVFHGLLEILEPRGIPFRKSQGYSGGHFRKSNDRLYFKIVEELVEKSEDTKRRRSYYTTWQTENKVPCGRLTFILNPENWGIQKEKRWVESEKLTLETITSEMVKAISKHFADLQRERQEEAVRQEKARIEWEIKRKKEMEEEAIRQQEEAKRRHAESLEQTARTRQEDLLKAAEWWRLYRGTEDFIAECERRWRAAHQGGELAEDQKTWLAWAQEVAKGVSPFESAYPDPARDGVFDAGQVPFGGPYPEQRKFSQPPTMPTIPAPVVVQQSYGQEYRPEPKPYPFWLKYQRR